MYIDFPIVFKPNKAKLECRIKNIYQGFMLSWN